MRPMRMFPVIAAVTVMTLSTALPAGATVTLQATRSYAACPPHTVVILPGGLCAVHAFGRTRPRGEPMLAGLQDLGTVNIVSFNSDTYGITDQPTNGNGRLQNHLYMWSINPNNWTTQIWTVWFDNGNKTYVFQSAYNGSGGGVAYGCINVPGFTTASGIQLIVYSCAGSPNNERFALPSVPGTGGLADYMRANYKPNPYVAIGNNFPGNGAWVITWESLAGLNNARWQFTAPGAT